MRATKNLTNKLERSLLAYATAASAAGVGIALAPTADAKVVYTPAHVVLRLGDNYNVDLNHDDTTDFTIKNLKYCSSDFCYFGLLEQPVYNFAVGDSRFAAALRRGVQIDSRLKFSPRVGVLASYWWGVNGTGTSGNWVNVKHRYLGLKLQVKGKTHYGWARLNVKVQGPSITGTLTGYAYETIPGKGIVAGNRGSTTGQGPDAEPVSLGHLALGASGMKKHKQAAPFPAPN